MNGSAMLTMLRAGAGSCTSTEAPPGESGGYRIFSPGTGGFGEDGSAIVRECVDFMATDVGISKVTKLMAADASDRHLFIVVHPQDWPHIFLTLNNLRSLPTESPPVPEGVDALWVVPFSDPAQALYWASGHWSQTTVAGWTPTEFAWA
jgi:hypothetical protein